MDDAPHLGMSYVMSRCMTTHRSPNGRMLAESWNAVVPCRAPDVATRAHQSRCTLFSPTAGRYDRKLWIVEAVTPTAYPPA